MPAPAVIDRLTTNAKRLTLSLRTFIVHRSFIGVFFLLLFPILYSLFSIPFSPPVHAACNLTVQVSFSDGSPAAGAKVEVRQNIQPFGVIAESQTGPNGLANVDIGQAGAYIVKGLFGILPEGRTTGSFNCGDNTTITLGSAPPPGTPITPPPITPPGTTPAPPSGPSLKAPDPKPCEAAQFTDKLTKNVLPPIKTSFSALGEAGEKISFNEYIDVPVDFSKLEAIFATSNSNYLESDFQNQTHQQANILGLNSQDFNAYHGPGQKTAPKVMIDMLRQKFVRYVADNPEVMESDDQFTDFEGNNPQTIYDLVTQFNYPNPPSLDGDEEEWQNTWGPYWEKIPTAVSEFYYGIFTFPMVQGEWHKFAIEERGHCPIRDRSIYFVLPEYFRTASIANQLNQIMVPYEAQSSYEKLEKGNFFDKTLGAAENIKNSLGNLVRACLEPFMDTPLAKNLKRVIKIGFEFLIPLKQAYALTKPPPFQPVPESCIKINLRPLDRDKPGLGPFCSLPELTPQIEGERDAGQPQLKRDIGEGCTATNNPNQLDQGQNVICTFKAHFFRNERSGPREDDQRLTIQTEEYFNEGGGPKGPNDFDKCVFHHYEYDPTTGDTIKIYECSITVWIYPIFYIPWLAPIWNNTTYSDQKEQDQKAVFGTSQQTGRPGIFGFFTPKAVEETVFPGGDSGKNLPSQEQGNDEAIRQRFFGATDCNKNFVRDVVLKPKVLQEMFGITPGCSAE